MLGVLQLEEIGELLLRIPSLVDRLERHDPSFPDAVKAWLAQAEQALVQNRQPAAAEVAALRGIVIGAQRGVVPAGIAFTGRTTPRKVRDAAAAEALRRAEALVSEVIRGPAAQLVEAERLVRQLVALAARKGLIAPPSSPSQGAVALWSALCMDAELGSAAAHVAGLIRPQNALILLARALPTPAG